MLKLHVNGRTIAENLFKQESDCYTTFSRLRVVNVVGHWFSRYDETHTTHAALAKVLAENSGEFLAPFVSWHAEQWVEQVTGVPAQKAFLNAYHAHLTVGFTTRFWAK
jgi:hypothetical protein